MRQVLIKIYELLTAGIYRRLARDLTLQLQGISKAYIDQHEMLTAKIVDELVRLNLRLEQVEVAMYAKNYSDLVMSEESGAVLAQDDQSAGKLTEEEIYKILQDASTTLDVVTFCAQRDIPLKTYYELDAKYRGFDPHSLRKMRVLEETNLELRRALDRLLSAQGQKIAETSNAQMSLLREPSPEPISDATAIEFATAAAQSNTKMAVSPEGSTAGSVAPDPASLTVSGSQGSYVNALR